MASPETFKFENTEQGVAKAYVAFTAGATGAVGAISKDSGQFDTANIKRISAGFYKFPLLDLWSAREETLPAINHNKIAYSSSAGVDGTVIQGNVSCESNRTIVANGSSDNVVASTKTWTFANGAFTASEVGAKIQVTGCSHAANNSLYTIASVTSATVVVVTETVANDETFSSSVQAALTDVPYISVLFAAPNGGAAADPGNGVQVEVSAELKWDGA